MNKRVLITIVVVAILGVASLIVLSLPTTVWARAGGGQDFVPSGGDFDVGGFSDFDSYDADTDYDGGSVGAVPVPCGGFGSFAGLIVFIVIIIVVGYLIKRARRKAGREIGRTMRESGLSDWAQRAATGAGAMPQANVPAELAKLKQKDPNFNEQAFASYVQNAFYKIQEAWETQNLSIARPYLNDQLMQRYANQINDLKSRGERNVLENMVIGHQAITNVRSDALYDYITVRIEASATDYTVDQNNQIIRGDKKIKPFVESWTFVRKGDVKTDLKKGAQTDTCPSCGAQLKLNATGQCEYCGAIVSSGEYDWVLSEIEQGR